MELEPNFVLGIKQKSLASKEDSHVHITVRSHTCLSAGSRLHSILQPPWLTTVSRSSNQASRDLIYQICTNPSFAWWNQNHRHASQPLTTNTQKSGHLKPCHAPPRTSVISGKSPMRCLRFLTTRSCSCTHAAITASLSTDLQNLRFQPSSDLTRALMRL